MKKQLFIKGESLEREAGEVKALAKRVLAGNIVAQQVIVQPDGDTRYWGVDVRQSGVLRRLKEFGEAHFKAVVGKPPVTSMVMVNHISARRAPTGSGGGWHRDSFRAQYKAIAYLTDVDWASQGAFCCLPGSNGPLIRAMSAFYRLLTGGNRYSDRLISGMLKLGLHKEVLLSKAGVPVFVDTSLIHRGLPISQGCRVTAFVYMFEKELTEEFRALLETGSYTNAAAK